MAYCPKCKNQYREGFTVCAECQCELVDSLEEPEVVLEKEPEPVWIQEEVTAEEPKPDSKPVLYRNSAERAEDNKTSAWTLLSVGIVGVAVMMLIIAGIIPLRFYGLTRYLIYGVMLVMFLLFVIMGIVSLRNSKIFAKKAESENMLTQTMKEWCKSSLNSEELDNQLFGTEELKTPEELKYFKRCELLKQKISEKFMNLDEGFLESFVDSIYENIFAAQEQ